jgi:hypothetical protein
MTAVGSIAASGVKGRGRPASALAATADAHQGKVPLFLIGLDAAKEALFARLRLTQPGPGYLHFPPERDAEFFRQLTSERVVTRFDRGRPSGSGSRAARASAMKRSTPPSMRRPPCMVSSAWGYSSIRRPTRLAQVHAGRALWQAVGRERARRYVAHSIKVDGMISVPGPRPSIHGY